MKTNSTKKTTKKGSTKKITPINGVHGITKPAPGQGKIIMLDIDRNDK